MKAVTVRLPEKDLEFLQKIRDVGFSSVGEVIKCATLSLAKAADKKKQRV